MKPRCIGIKITFGNPVVPTAIEVRRSGDADGRALLHPSALRLLCRNQRLTQPIKSFPGNPADSRIVSESGESQPAGFSSSLERLKPGKTSVVAERFFDPDELIIFGCAIRPRQRSCLDLAGAGCNCQVGDCGIFGLA